MTNYGLKVNSKYDLSEYEERVMTTAGDVVLFEAGVYKIYCDGDTFVKHNIINNLMHITCISVRDDIKINIEAAGIINDGISDVHHKIICRNKNVYMTIKVKSALDNDVKIIYRSSIGGVENSTGVGKQDAKFIMLSNECEIDAEPSLDLASNLIPTTHNVAMSGVSKESIFYMSLHGLNNKESEIELVQSFLNS
jgi:hypothetical protein